MAGHVLNHSDLRFLNNFELKCAKQRVPTVKMLGCDHWGLVGYPESKMVRFSNLVGVVIGPLSKKLAVK